MYYQLHVLASTLAIIRFTLSLNLSRDYKICMVCSREGGGTRSHFTIVGSMNVGLLGWSIDICCSFCREAPRSTLCGLVYVRSSPLCNYYLCSRCGAGTCELVQYSNRRVVYGSKFPVILVLNKTQRGRLTSKLKSPSFKP